MIATGICGIVWRAVRLHEVALEIMTNACRPGRVGWVVSRVDVRNHGSRDGEGNGTARGSQLRKLVAQMPCKTRPRFPLIIMLRRGVAVWRGQSEGAAAWIRFILRRVVLRNIRFGEQDVVFV